MDLFKLDARRLVGNEQDPKARYAPLSLEAIKRGMWRRRAYLALDAQVTVRVEI